jgi:FkbM family methyltransferase
MRVRAFADQLKVTLVMIAEGTTFRPRRFFSQFGEDCVLQSLLGSRADSPGFYVDIGAFAPKTYSNTYWLYKRGWRGINVDPTPGSMRPFRLMRRRDINLEIAISNQPGTITFYQLGLRTVLNTVSLEVAARWEAELGRKARTLEVQARSLASVLDEHTDGLIDLLTVDVEGHDLAVLQSNDWDRFRPTLVVVEDHSVAELEQSMRAWEALGASDVSRFMMIRGYDLCAWTPPSVFFREREDQALSK